PVDHGADPDTALDAVTGQATFAQFPLVAVHAGAAAVDRGGDERVKLEVLCRHARATDDVHAQPGRHRPELGIADEVGEAVIDVVHAHDRCGRPRGFDRRVIRTLCLRFGDDRVDEVGVPGRD